jgi:hypothetical protein
MTYMKYLLTLETIGCLAHSSGAGNDDLYFRVYIDNSETSEVIPENPDMKNSWDIDEGQKIRLQPSSCLQNDDLVPGKRLKFEFTNSVRVEIWDYDWPSDDDLLGEADFKPDDPPNTTKCLSNEEEGSEYSIEYSINEIN